MSKKHIPQQEYISFTKEMKKDYKILVPMMLQMHFKLMCGVLRNYGYDVELLETTGPHIAEEGLRHVPNDACYPAILVIGPFIDAIKRRWSSSRPAADAVLPITFPFCARH